MLRMCLWHAWSDVCWLFHCFFDCLKALNENCTYGRHIPLQINHMSDIMIIIIIICYNDFSTVTAEHIIFLLCKLQYTNAHDLWNGYMHWNQWNHSFWHGGIFQVYIPGICKNLEYVRHIADICPVYGFQMNARSYLLRSNCLALTAPSVGLPRRGVLTIHQSKTLNIISQILVTQLKQMSVELRSSSFKSFKTITNTLIFQVGSSIYGKTFAILSVLQLTLLPRTPFWSSDWTSSEFESFLTQRSRPGALSLGDLDSGRTGMIRLFTPTRSP